MPRGVFVGLSTIDIVYSVDQFPASNLKIAAQGQDVYVGGPAANAAIAFAHLGGRSTLATAIGRHALAAVLQDEFRAFSIHAIDLAPTFDGIPPISSVSVNRLGQRNVVSANGSRVEGNYSDALDPQQLEQARVVLVDGHYMRACQAWVEAAHARRIPVVMDGGSWKPGTDELIRFVDYMVCSADFRPPGCAGEDDIVRYLKAAHIKHIAITRGPEPIRFFAEGTCGELPVPEVPVVDTMGAGDIFHGAFCHSLATGCSFVDSLRAAAQVAAESCRYRGTRQWMSRPVR